MNQGEARGFPALGNSRAIVSVMGYLYLFGTVFFTVYGLLVIKWRVAQHGNLPEEFSATAGFLVAVLLDPWVISGFCAALLASLFWIAAMTKFDLSYAYPFQTLSFVLVVLLSIWLFGEPITVHKLVGMVLIVSGILVSSQSL
jgi:multidrug transporter EmrE-like cation transporter